MLEVTDTFDPVQYSWEENEFLLQHVGEPPVVALKARPANVIQAAVKPVLDRIYELIELEKHNAVTWVGIERVKEAIQTYLVQSRKWASDKRTGAPRFPSMYAYDSRNKPHRGGVGSDSGQVHTYFDAKGQRQPFAVPLIVDDIAAWKPDWDTTEVHGTDNPDPVYGLKNDAENQRLECMICGSTESYSAESQISFNAARARMGKHLITAKDPLLSTAHRELHTREFGG